jgi:hypothetical protein
LCKQDCGETDQEKDEGVEVLEANDLAAEFTELVVLIQVHQSFTVKLDVFGLGLLRF